MAVLSMDGACRMDSSPDPDSPANVLLPVMANGGRSHFVHDVSERKPYLSILGLEEALVSVTTNNFVITANNS